MNDQRERKHARFSVALACSALGLGIGLLGQLLAQNLALVASAAILIVGSWLLPVLYAVRYRGALARLSLASKRDVQSAQRAVIATVDESRAKTSRHEYHQERALTRIESELRRLTVLLPGMQMVAEEPAIDAMFVTSNGAGLGHVSRLLAVADKLPAGRRFELLTLSKAYKQVAAPGLTVHYFPSSEATGETTQRWNQVFRDHVRNLLAARRPSVVVFDGTWVYTGLTDVCRAMGVPLVWMQRGMWKEEVDQASTQRHAAASVADHVIIPGDYAGGEIVDLGPGIQPQYVEPIVRTKREDLLSREAACAMLGLDPAGRYVLLNLGGGSISDPDSVARAALTSIQLLTPELTAVQVASPLIPKIDDVTGLIRVAAYPVMRYARAFEYMVAAAGYNSAQEAASLGIPTVLVPNVDTKTDDQLRRARLLAEKGLVLAAVGSSELERALRKIGDPIYHDTLARELTSVEEPRGAMQAAGIIDRIIDQAHWPRRAETIGEHAPSGNGKLASPPKGES